MSSGTARAELVGERLHLVGTVHVDPASAKAVGDLIRQLRPEVVALELDQARMAALENPLMARKSGSAGLSFLAMVLLEKFAGQLTGSPPGTEMLRAAHAARSVGARIELIDLPVSMTIVALRQLPLGEKVRLVVDSVVAMLVLPFGRRALDKLTEDIGDQLEGFRKRYPTLGRLLLDVREECMAARLRGVLDSSRGPVVAVVGFGHVGALKRMFGNYRGKPVFSTGFAWTVSGGQ